MALVEAAAAAAVVLSIRRRLTLPALRLMCWESPCQVEGLILGVSLFAFRGRRRRRRGRKRFDENVGTEDKGMNSRQVKVQVEWLFVALRGGGVVVVRVSCDVALW